MNGDLKAWAIVLGVNKKNEKPKAGEEATGVTPMPDELNLQFIYGRLKRLLGGGSDGSADK
jgi:hypothetical protein